MCLNDAFKGIIYLPVFVARNKNKWITPTSISLNCGIHILQPEMRMNSWCLSYEALGILLNHPPCRFPASPLGSVWDFMMRYRGSGDIVEPPLLVVSRPDTLEMNISHHKRQHGRSG